MRYMCRGKRLRTSQGPREGSGSLRDHAGSIRIELTCREISKHCNQQQLSRNDANVSHAPVLGSMRTRVGMPSTSNAWLMVSCALQSAVQTCKAAAATSAPNSGGGTVTNLQVSLLEVKRYPRHFVEVPADDVRDRRVEGGGGCGASALLKGFLVSVVAHEQHAELFGSGIDVLVQLRKLWSEALAGGAPAGG